MQNQWKSSVDSIKWAPIELIYASLGYEKWYCILQFISLNLNVED